LNEEKESGLDESTGRILRSRPGKSDRKSKEKSRGGIAELGAVKGERCQETRKGKVSSRARMKDDLFSDGDLSTQEKTRKVAPAMHNRPDRKRVARDLH